MCNFRNNFFQPITIAIMFTYKIKGNMLAMFALQYCIGLKKVVLK